MKTFADYPEFKPNITPSEMFKMGVFGGTYFRPIYSAVTKKKYRNEHLEFPSSWFKGLDINTYITGQKCDPSLNYYRVKSGTSLRFWESKGWIKSQDPYGWVQWYMRFYLGRRTSDDRRQIDRWLGICGDKSRFRNRLIKMCYSQGKKYNDPSVSPVIRQLLLQWGYELTAEDYNNYTTIQL